MTRQPAFYKVSDTPVGGLFQGDGNRLRNGQLVVTSSSESRRRPDSPSSAEHVVGRWFSTEMDVVGKFGNGKHGSVAVGQGYLLLTDRFLRGTVFGSGSRNRVLMARNGNHRLSPFHGTYAFLFDLATDAAEFTGNSKVAGLSTPDSGIVVTDPLVADENWNHKAFALPGRRTIEFGAALLAATVQARQMYGDEQASLAAANLAGQDWESRLASTGRTTPLLVKF